MHLAIAVSIVALLVLYWWAVRAW